MVATKGETGRVKGRHKRIEIYGKRKRNERSNVGVYIRSIGTVLRLERDA